VGCNVEVANNLTLGTLYALHFTRYFV